MSILIGRLSNDVFPMVQHIIESDQEESSKATWDILSTTYAERGFNYKTQLIIELPPLTSGSFAEIQAYANHHLELCRRIINLRGLSLEDSCPAIFLHGLGAQYSLWATGAKSKARKDGPPRVLDLLAELVDEERLVNRENSTPMALLTNQKRLGPGCSECEKLGHNSTRCCRLHPELNPHRKARTTKASGSQSQAPGNQSDRPPGGRTSDQWFIDNGAKSHSFCGLKEAFSNYHSIPPGRSVEGVGGAIQVLGIGDIILQARLSSGAVNLLKLSGVQHTPGLPAIFISGRLVSQRGYDSSLISGQLFHPVPGAILAETSNVRGLYVLNLLEPQATAYLSEIEGDQLDAPGR